MHRSSDEHRCGRRPDRRSIALAAWIASGAWIGCSDDASVDPPGPPEEDGISFAAAATRISEMTRVLEVVLVRTGDAGDSMQVRLDPVSGTAIASVDFAGGSRMTGVPAGAREHVVAVAIVPDSTAEADETFTIEIASTTPAFPIAEPRVLEVTVTDLATEFSLPDVNPNSPSLGSAITPRDRLQQISAWYFGHAT
jgi:hypothetical protein